MYAAKSSEFSRQILQRRKRHSHKRTCNEDNMEDQLSRMESTIVVRTSTLPVVFYLFILQVHETVSNIAKYASELKHLKHDVIATEEVQQGKM